MKRSIERAMASGALGIKVRVSGRMGGAEIARTEWLKEGRLPLQTFRADIDYGFREAEIAMGRIGVKVWIFKKEHFKKSEQDLLEEVRLIEKEKIDELAKQQEESPAPTIEEDLADDAAGEEEMGLEIDEEVPPSDKGKDKI